MLALYRCRLQTADRLLARPNEKGAKPKRMLSAILDRKFFVDHIIRRMRMNL
jgi:hypothetical protein